MPRSIELSTLIERSGFTLPMIWAPLPADRCASCCVCACMRAAEHEPPIGQFELCVLVRLRRPELSMVEAFARLSFPCLACLLACPVRLRRPPAWAVVANSESALAFFLLFEFCWILCFFFFLYTLFILIREKGERGKQLGRHMLTRFRYAVMFPSASMSASSPRSCMTLPTIMTFLPTYELR